METVQRGAKAGELSCAPAVLLVLLGCLLCGAWAPANAATLTHRYSFNGDATDSVGGADGTLQGNAYISNNAVVLDGSNSYVALPPNLLTNYTAVSFEVWFADTPANAPLTELYNFRGAQGEITYLFRGQGIYDEPPTMDAVTLPYPVAGRTNHFVWTQDSASNDARIYINGQLVAENTAFVFDPTTIGPTSTNLIGGGGGVYNAPYFNGSILEFRIYQGALSATEVACNDLLGPDQLPIDPGALQDVRLELPTPTGPGAKFHPPVFADYANISNVNISSMPDLVLTSDNTNVVNILPNHFIQTLSPGAANLTISWEGLTNTDPVQVGQPYDISLLHRYSFSEPTNDWVARDSAGGWTGIVSNSVASGHVIPAFTGTGQITFTGYPNGSKGHVILPPGIISTLSEVSIEAWVNWNPGNAFLGYGSGGWQRIFDFGSESGGRGISYLFLTPATDNISFTTSSVLHSAITLNQNINETPRLNWTNKMPTNVPTFVAVTYSPIRGTMKMYLNGVPVSSGTATLPLSGIADTNNWLGMSQFSVDPFYNGSFDEFRVYGGFMSDSDIAADYNAGPNAVGVDYELHCFPGTNSVTITWGPSAAGLTLESSPTVGPDAVWSPVSVVPIFQNGRFVSTVPISPGAAYFRLQGG